MAEHSPVKRTVGGSSPPIPAMCSQWRVCPAGVVATYTEVPRSVTVYMVALVKRGNDPMNRGHLPH